MELCGLHLIVNVRGTCFENCSSLLDGLCVFIKRVVPLTDNPFEFIHLFLYQTDCPEQSCCCTSFDSEWVVYVQCLCQTRGFIKRKNQSRACLVVSICCCLLQLLHFLSTVLICQIHDDAIAAECVLVSVGIHLTNSQRDPSAFHSTWLSFLQLLHMLLIYCRDGGCH